MPTRISVVVPTLDTRELTLACVTSVLASNLPAAVELEVVVVDDGSHDGTGEELSALPGVRVLRNDEPVGYSRAVGLGAGEATGDLLVLLNSDANLEPESLARVAAAFAADGSLGIAGAALRYPEGTPQWSSGREPGLAWLFAQASGFPALLGRLPGWRRLKPIHAAEDLDVGWVSGAAMAVRASVWRELGPFDVRYRFYGQDLDFCLRVLDRGWRVRFLPGFRAFHHHGATISSRGDIPTGNADLGLLWSDLLLWAEKRRGASFAGRARRAILAGASVRIAARQLSLPFVPSRRRVCWRAGTASIARARAAVRGLPESGVRS